MAFAATTAKILRGKKDKEGKMQSIAGSCQSPEDKVAVSKQRQFHFGTFHFNLYYVRNEVELLFSAE